MRCKAQKTVEQKLCKRWLVLLERSDVRVCGIESRNQRSEWARLVIKSCRRVSKGAQQREEVGDREIAEVEPGAISVCLS